jgi:diadenosine tetraphosphate (Ap4A) HIT family hydrolase
MITMLALELMVIQMGYQTVLSVIGPNLNEDRPNCEPSLTIALDKLRLCYQQVFDAFISQVSASEQQSFAGRQSGSIASEPLLVRESSISDAKRPRTSAEESLCEERATTEGATSSSRTDPGVPSSIAVHQGRGPMTVPIYNKPIINPRDAKYHAPPTGKDFRHMLYNFIDHPSRYPELIFMDMETCVVIYDVYPKASMHLLLIPKPSFLGVVHAVAKLNSSHADRIKELHAVATHIATCLTDAESSSTRPVRFKVGYHARPSLFPLHCHIISDDFKSECLKVIKPTV